MGTATSRDFIRAASKRPIHCSALTAADPRFSLGRGVISHTAQNDLRGTLLGGAAFHAPAVAKNNTLAPLSGGCTKSVAAPTLPMFVISGFPHHLAVCPQCPNQAITNQNNPVCETKTNIGNYSANLEQLLQSCVIPSNDSWRFCAQRS